MQWFIDLSMRGDKNHTMILQEELFISSLFRCMVSTQAPCFQGVLTWVVTPKT